MNTGNTTLVDRPHVSPFVRRKSERKALPAPSYSARSAHAAKELGQRETTSIYPPSPFFQESWRNINAINDSIREAFSTTDKVVVSVLRGNAGAGGAMAAMASDLVWAHENVIINPHYKVRRSVIPAPPFVATPSWSWGRPPPSAQRRGVLSVFYLYFCRGSLLRIEVRL